VVRRPGGTEIASHFAVVADEHICGLGTTPDAARADALRRDDLFDFEGEDVRVVPASVGFVAQVEAGLRAEEGKDD
jgi:hypothetical protein